MVFRFRFLFIIGALFAFASCNQCQQRIAFISDSHPSKTMVLYNNGQVINATNAFYAIWDWTDAPEKKVVFSWQSSLPAEMTNYLKFTVPATSYFGIFFQVVSNVGAVNVANSSTNVSGFAGGKIHFWFKADRAFRGKLAAFIKSDNKTYNGSFTPGMAYWWVPDSFCDGSWHETNMSLNSFTLDGRDSTNFSYKMIANFFGIMTRPDGANHAVGSPANFYLDDIYWTSGRGSAAPQSIKDDFNRSNAASVGSPWSESESNNSKVAVEDSWLKFTGGNNGSQSEAYVLRPGVFGSFDLSFRFKVDSTNFITRAGVYQDSGSGAQLTGYEANINGKEVNICYAGVNIPLATGAYILTPGEIYSCHFSMISGNITLTVNSESNANNVQLMRPDSSFYRFNRVGITGGGTAPSSLYVDDFIFKMY